MGKMHSFGPKPVYKWALVPDPSASPHLLIMLYCLFYFYRFSWSWCLLAYLFIRVGSPNEGLHIDKLSAEFFSFWKFCFSIFKTCDCLLSGCRHVWMWTTCLCCFLFLVNKFTPSFSSNHLYDLKDNTQFWLLCWLLCWLSWSITELVKVEKNGLLFSSSSELADELVVSR